MRGRGQGMGKWHRTPKPSPSAPLSQHLYMFTNPEAPQIPSFWVSMEASLYKYNWLTHWPLVIDSPSSPSPLSPPWKSGGGTESSKPLIKVGSPGNQPPSLGAFQKSPQEHKPGCGGKGLFWITRHPFHLYGSEGISGTEDRRPDIITKDALIYSFHSGNSKSFGKLWARNHERRPNLYKSHKSQYQSTFLKIKRNHIDTHTHTQRVLFVL